MKTVSLQPTSGQSFHNRTCPRRRGIVPADVATNGRVILQPSCDPADDDKAGGYSTWMFDIGPVELDCAVPERERGPVRILSPGEEER